MQVILQKYFRKQKKAFEKNLSKARETDDMETIHQLRLSVKRIRALFTYFSFVAGKPKAKKSIKQLKQIYKPAGNIRDIQVQIDLVKVYQKRLSIKYDLYMNYLVAKENSAYKSLKKSIVDFDEKPLDVLEDKTNRMLEKNSGKALLKMASEIFDQKLEEVRHLNQIPTNKDKNLHEIRRILKEVRYLLDIFDGEIKEIKSLKVSYNRLKQIEKTLGKWHDQLNAEFFLQSFLKEAKLKEAMEIERYKILQKSIERYKLLLLKRINLAFKFELEV